MPTPNGRSWLGDKMLRLADRIGPSGNNYNRETGQWSATPAQYATGIGSTLLKMVNPAAGQIAAQLANGYYGSGPAAGLMAKLGASPTATGNPNIGPVTREQIGFPSSQAPAYANARPAMNMPTMPAVQAEAPWTGSLAGSNPFGGAYGGNLGFAGNQPRSYGRSAGSFTPYGAGAIQVAGQGWAGSDAAAGFGLGAQGAGSSSAGSIALADAMRATKKNR